jgi:glycosyltransferase involved in cell wall biosynthesis
LTRPARETEVAICLATYQPQLEPLRRQLTSIRDQTFTDWHCWLVDDGSDEHGRAAIEQSVAGDPRFTVVHHPENVGFYRNFERAVRGRGRWIALSDQDDIWTPHKLQTLLEAAQRSPGAPLVYCDVEIHDAAGAVVSPTYWVGRQHNERNLAALLFANTVSGAASLFDDSLLEHALPFPARYPTSFHDHWLALVARCMGGITYVDAPLQIYVQHASNAIGHRPAAPESVLRVALRTLRRRWWRRPDARYYDDEVARLSDMSRTLLDRVDAAPEDQRVLRAVASLHSPSPAVGWLAAQCIRESGDASVTMWRRRRVLASVAWTQLARVHSRLRLGSRSGRP